MVMQEAPRFVRFAGQSKARDLELSAFNTVPVSVNKMHSEVQSDAVACLFSIVIPDASIPQTDLQELIAYLCVKFQSYKSEMRVFFMALRQTLRF
ncbi:hypothetical protein BZK31_00700 [Pseudomonas floridensis]|uniref:Uncharacterized protein n=1 Tax=Pseudomonas floridensis TaxID=1958950 RepID=A0A1X0NCN2_9PSED|nr:hypothetical protein BZK31_00700 [Pseudomonas floridensis]